MLEPRRIMDFEKIDDSFDTSCFLEHCEMHSKQTEKFCQDCNVSFCSECSKLHKEHNIQDIDSLVSMYLKRQRDIKSQIERCSSEQDEIASRLTNISSGVKRSVEEFMTRKRLLLVIIAGIINGNMKHLMTYENETKMYFQRELDLLNNHLEELKRMLDKHREPKTIKDVATLLKEDKHPLRNGPEFLNNGILPVLNYPNESECENVLRFLCGTIITSPSTSSNLPKALMHELIPLEEISSVYHLCVRRRTDYLVSDNLGHLLHVNTEKKYQTVIQTTASQNGYFTSTLDGEIIFYIDSSAEKVIKVCSDIKREIFWSEKRHWRLRCLTLSKNGTDIIIGMANNKEEFKLSRHSIDGKKVSDIRLQRYMYDDLPFSKVINICENINGDICLSLLKSSVTSVQNNGNIRFSYAGYESKSAFFPKGICADNDGRIIICNCAEKSASIHLLNENGVFLGMILTKEQCKAIPLSVYIDNSLLFVGWFEQKFLTCYNLE